MKGVVRGREARVVITVRGPDGDQVRTPAVIDTGSMGCLTLPSAVIARLRLPRRSTIRAQLADGSEGIFAVYSGEVVWNRRVIPIDIEESEAVPLIGMTLLNGYELNIQVRQDGKVSIKPLPQPPSRR